MAFNGDGTFSFPYSWTNDAANGVPITASRMDTQFSNATQGFDLCLTRDGQGSAQANLPMNSFKLTGLGAATVGGDALSFGGSITVADITATTITGTLITASTQLLGMGTATNDDAATGYIGEYIHNTGTSVGMTSGSYVNVTTVSLTAGDWDVSANIVDTSSGSVSTQILAGIVTSSGAAPTPTNGGAFIHIPTGGSEIYGVPVGTMRQSLASTATVYLVCRYDIASGSQGTVTGFLAARRAR